MAKYHNKFTGLGYMCKDVDGFQLAWDSIQWAGVKQVKNPWVL
jgi:hypothetical protein